MYSSGEIRGPGSLKIAVSPRPASTTANVRLVSPLVGTRQAGMPVSRSADRTTFPV